MAAQQIRFLGEYPTFEAAASAAGGAKYEEADLIAARLHKARQHYRQGTQHKLIAAGLETRDLLSQIARVHRPEHPFHALDFGGGYGAAYAWAKRSTLQSEIFWACVDVPVCVRSAQEFATKHVRFFETIDAANTWAHPVDLVYVNSVLQYVPEPEQVIEQLLALEPNWAMFMRTVLGPRRVVQIMESPLSWEYAGSLPLNILDRQLQHPVVVMAADEFRGLMGLHGYELVHSIRSQGGDSAAFQDEQFLFRRKA